VTWIKLGLRQREFALSAIDAIVHLFGLILPALGLGAISAALAKLAWRAELRGVRWTRLAAGSATAATAVLAGGLVVFGRDGMMATYAAMVLASALALLWLGFAGR
jgi:hypothetical protein